MNDKHAFLIIAHNQFDILEKLIIMLDDDRNDIFLHIDKRVEHFNKNRFSALVKHSELHFTKRIAVYWGHSSQVDCELLLLGECLKHGPYQFVHLLSGVDLPIKTQDEIHRFFDEHPNTQFLQIGWADRHLYRLEKYHFFLKHTHAPERIKGLVNKTVNAVTAKLRINRLKKYGDMEIVKTANWFSITGECAEYVYSKRRFIRRLTRFTVCADEMFLGTVIRSSPFWSQVYNPEPSWDGHMRYIDRIRNVGSSPHIFTINDKDHIIESKMLFARKFDENVDNEIIRFVYHNYLKGSVNPCQNE